MQEILMESSAGILITDEQYRVIWANKFEEDFYRKTFGSPIGLYVVDCHKEMNREKIAAFLDQFKTGEIKGFTKYAHGMVITYSSYFKDNVFAGIVRTRIRTPK